ncbi:hypothetical protein BJ912DRAFT_214420 [Pholiota molesta]|nr:hypothetical protein BJ912DRAFT_214420 [Pholiota molesta]
MSRQDILRHLLQEVQKFKASLPPPPPRLPPTTPRPQIPTLALDLPLSRFRSQMRKSGLLPQVSNLTLLKAEELASFYQKTYQRMCLRLLDIPRHSLNMTSSEVLENLATTHKALFEEQDLPRLLNDALQAQSSHLQLSGTTFSQQSERRTFNHDYTPLLEKYFEQNAYPSGPDRLALARKSSMSPRQIEVWFQNHRSRAKKDGRNLKRLNPAMTVSLESLEETRQNSTVSSINEVDVDDEHMPTINTSLESSSAGFSFSAPSHAFPTTYPPRCSQDPFPIRNGHFNLPPPVWRRVSAVSSIHPTVPITVDELASQFATKLVLRESISSKRNPHASRTPSQIPWFAATTTTPCSAPLASLIRTKYSMLPNTPSRFSASTRRKATFLPKRTPKNFPKFPRNISASTLSSPFESWSSRATSFTSELASQSRNSSFSSIASSSSSSSSSPSPLQSPHLPTIELSTPIVVNQYAHSSDVDLDDLFGNIFSSLPQPNEFFVDPSIDKSSFPLDCNIPSLWSIPLDSYLQT